MSPSVVQRTLTGSDPSEKFYHAGGAANFSFQGNFGGGSVAFEFNLDTSQTPDNDLWTSFREDGEDVVPTVDYGNSTVPLGPCWVRATPTGVTSVKFIWSPVKFL